MRPLLVTQSGTSCYEDGGVTAIHISILRGMSDLQSWGFMEVLKELHFGKEAMGEKGMPLSLVGWWTGVPTAIFIPSHKGKASTPKI